MPRAGLQNLWIKTVRAEYRWKWLQETFSLDFCLLLATIGPDRHLLALIGTMPPKLTTLNAYCLQSIEKKSTKTIFLYITYLSRYYYTGLENKDDAYIFNTDNDK